MKNPLVNIVSGSPQTLRDLFELESCENYTLVQGSLDTAIEGLSCDTRNLKKKDLFFALGGHDQDGMKFLPEAVAKGATALFCHSLPKELPEKGITVLFSEQLRQIMPRLASRFYGQPSRSLKAVAVTGTNGKTSLSWILSQALSQALDGPSVSSGTLGLWCWKGKAESESIVDLGITTPSSIDLQSFIATAQSIGAKSFVSEVSSHALSQGRAGCIDWDLAIFTNLSRDHLDFHTSMEDYFRAKCKLFTEGLGASTKKTKLALLNIDDPYIESLYQELKKLPLKTLSFSSEGSDADFVTEKAEHSSSGTKLTIRRANGERISIESQLCGSYNSANLLMAASALVGLGLEPLKVEQVLANVTAPPGRLQKVIANNFNIFIDYAHTPDALEKACLALKEITDGDLILLFGCGGDRDRGKRPLMAKIAAKHANFVVFTSDNPRGEKPEKIIEDILTGVPVSFKEFKIQVDRKSAIADAISLAKKGDSVLIAGKGHESYQEVDGEKLPFSDLLIAKSFLAEGSANVS